MGCVFCIPWNDVGIVQFVYLSISAKEEVLCKIQYVFKGQFANVWCIFTTGDHLAIAKETGRRLGMGTNMYPSSSLLGQSKDLTIVGLPIDELIEKADGFAGVFPGMYMYLAS